MYLLSFIAVYSYMSLIMHNKNIETRTLLLTKALDWLECLSQLLVYVSTTTSFIYKVVTLTTALLPPRSDAMNGT